MATPPGYIFHSRPFIQEGDVVILYMKRDFIQAISVSSGKSIHNKFGKYNHSDMIGVKFGSRMISAPPNHGFIHLLRPTPELWTLSLPHRTQILYLPDISFIIDKLHVKTGAKVIEAGTGSGSMTHSLARNVRGVEGGGVGVEDGWMKEKGKGVVFSYEYHQERFEKAKIEFNDHGMNDTIHLRHRNVCKEGFGEVGDGVDAVFLDLPAPWEAIPHAVNALRSDVLTKICCFSPCIEQVTRTVTALDAEGFTDIEMHEVLTRAHEIQSSQPVFPTISSISNKLRKHAVKKEERRQYQIKSARARREDEIKRKEEEEKEVEMLDGDGDGNGDGDEVGGESKKRVREAGSEEEGETPRKKARVVNGAAIVESSRQGNAEATEATQTPVEEEDLANDEKEDQNAAEGDDMDDDEEESWKLSSTTLIGKPVPEMRGHTSYLTFAVLYPKSVRDEIDARPTTAMRTNRSVDVSAIGSPAVVAATREGSVGSEVSDSFAQALASMTEEELMGIS